MISNPNGWIGKPVRRKEDERLLKGLGRYLDDIDLPGMLHLALLRSPHAAAKIVRIDASGARSAPGVVAVLTHADLGPYGKPMPEFLTGPGLTHKVMYEPLARDRVKYAGEPVVAVLAEDRYQAEDALDRIEVEYDPLPAVVDAEAALREGSPRVHDEAPGNLAATVAHRVGDVEQALARAPHRLRLRLRINRGTAMPMETRGVVAQYGTADPEAPATGDPVLTVWTSTQAPHKRRDEIAGFLGLPPERVRVITPDVGGGFGAKVPIYPEEILVPLLAMRTGRPVKWFEDRREHFLSANHERLQVHDVEVGFDGEGRLLGLRDRFVVDLGAYPPLGTHIANTAALTIPGPYKIPALEIAFTCAYTHLTPSGAYRGAGRPQGCFAMERTIDAIAAHLGLDPADVRRHNLIGPHEMPYQTGLELPNGKRVVYDSGDFPKVLEEALRIGDYAALRAEQAQARAQGRLFGIGLAFAVENSASGPFEGGLVRVEPNGRVTAITGAPTNGQGHATVLAQISAEVLGVSPDDVDVIEGDTGSIEKGVGTFGSRVGATAGSAVLQASQAVREQVIRRAAQVLEAAEVDLELRDGRCHVRGVPGRSVSLAELALAAPGEPLAATRYFHPEAHAFASGMHVAAVEIDPDTRLPRVVRYAAVEDCGRPLNTLVVAGQVQGAIVQGIGNAFFEDLRYDESGQLLTGTFLDFLLPTAADVPAMRLGHVETRSPLNPLGVKGVGEAGVVPAAAALANAVADALRPHAGAGTAARENPPKGIPVTEIPYRCTG